MKYVLIFVLAFSISSADYIVKKTLACPNVLLLKKAPVNQGKNVMDFTLYSIANNCIIISKKDKVEAIGYDPRNSKEIYQQIVEKKTGKKFYILRENIMVEQGGKKNIFKF